VRRSNDTDGCLGDVLHCMDVKIRKGDTRCLNGTYVCYIRSYAFGHMLQSDSALCEAPYVIDGPLRLFTSSLLGLRFRRRECKVLC